jgi:HD-like signal output (HDOD) protein/CheY-like chemotaxis protein
MREAGGMNKRILFVDDEPLVLQGMQRLLRPMRQQWDMEFVESGDLALRLLESVPCDVIVSDMMMPGMNGVELLKKVLGVSPQTIRLVLSGQTDKELALQCVGVAHQFLAKPCDAQHLRNTITRVTGLGFAAHSERLMTLVGRLERLPSPPAIYSRLLTLLDDPACSTEAIGALISRDVALTAHLLKIVNSAYFGLAQQVNHPSEAVAYLGLDTLKAVTLTAGLLAQWTVDPASGFCMEAASDHGQKVATVARAIAEAERAPRIIVDECFIAGLLHDVGKLVLACNLPKEFVRLADKPEPSVLTQEAEIFGATHAEIGGYLFGLWGLPSAVVEATRLHHTPGDSPEPPSAFSALTAVHAAEYFVQSPSMEVSDAGLDEAYLASLGLTDRIPVWRTIAENLLTPYLSTV